MAADNSKKRSARGDASLPIAQSTCSTGCVNTQHAGSWSKPSTSLYRYARSVVPVAARREPCTVWQAGGTRLIPAAGVPRW